MKTLVLVVFLLFLICFSAAIFGTSLFVLENPPMELVADDHREIAGVLTFFMWIASLVTGGAVLTLAVALIGGDDD